MNDRRRQAEQALRVYLDRGSKALNSLSRGDFDHATDWLSKREAAFRNFLALEHIAARAELKAANDSEWNEMLEAASQQNMRLKLKLSETITIQKGKAQQLTASSRLLGKFIANSRRSLFSTAG